MKSKCFVLPLLVALGMTSACMQKSEDSPTQPLLLPSPDPANALTGTYTGIYFFKAGFTYENGMGNITGINFTERDSGAGNIKVVVAPGDTSTLMLTPSGSQTHYDYEHSHFVQSGQLPLYTHTSENTTFLKIQFAGDSLFFERQEIDRSTDRVFYSKYRLRKN